MDVCLLAVQMRCESGKIDENIARAERLLNDCRDVLMDNRTIICLPELFTTGYNLSREEFMRISEPVPGPTSDKLCIFAQEVGAYVYAGLVERVEEAREIFDSSVLISPSGKLIAKYRKIHLAGEYEKEIFSPGKEVVTASTDIGRLGLMICYDVVFPELSRSLALLGSDIILHCSAWYSIPREMDWGARHYKTLLNARAMENTVFIVSSNRVGTEGKFSFVGHSCIASPWGEILAEKKGGEGCISAVINLEMLKKCRIIHPCLQERKPEIYALK
ncbi:MAG: carbon-nitrogen hydrolase family protein [Nitrososphaerota archaeon]